jgi:hypothetical protein
MPHWRKVNPSDAGEALFSVPDLGDDFAAGIALIVGAFVFAVVIVPLLLFGVELIILGFLIAVGVLSRTLLRRAWVVQATPSGEARPALAWKVIGWRRSGRVIGEVAAQLSSGLEPVPAEHAEPIDALATERDTRARVSA